MNNGRKRWRKWSKLRSPGCAWAADDLRLVEAALVAARADEALRALERAQRAIREADQLACSISDQHAAWLRAVREHDTARRRERRQQMELPFGYDRLAF